MTCTQRWQQVWLFRDCVFTEINSIPINIGEDLYNDIIVYPLDLAPTTNASKHLISS